VHRACAKRALMKIPSLEDYEKAAETTHAGIHVKSGASQLFAVGKHRVPQGHFENSPAFERRGLTLS
jgi:hypothetical protein